ncbi:MAG: ABC transporter ATP-binding protein [Chlamydiota bacterium]
MLAVSCKNIKKSYTTGTTTVQALRGIDLEVHPNELLMIVGPSGSGKTTLLSVIAGILTQDEGECLIFERNLNAMSNGEKTAYRGKEIGFVFQAFNLVPTLTSAENAAIPLILNGTPPKIAEAKAAELLGQLGIPDKINTPPIELSGGQQQRVAIARGCLHNPKLIVCDEPTAYLDHDTGHKVMELLKTTALKENRAIIVVTHDPRIFEFADRIVKMEDGRIVG